MSAFVLDASMALAWSFPDERTSRAEVAAELSDERRVVVPGHWHAEVANGMLVGERKRRTTHEERTRFIERVGELDLEVDVLDSELMFSRILPLARAHDLTVYDTLYLELAERRGLPLASLDGALNDAARRVGIELVAGQD